MPLCEGLSVWETGPPANKCTIVSNHILTTLCKYIVKPYKTMLLWQRNGLKVIPTTCTYAMQYLHLQEPDQFY